MRPCARTGDGMTIGTAPENTGNGSVAAPASLVDALLVYAEPLASGAHVVVIGDAQSSVPQGLLDLGARGVHVFDPDPARAANASRRAPRGVTVRALVGDLDVRDGAFDLAVVPDVAELNDPRGAITRLRRAVATDGAVVAMGRAKLAHGEGDGVPFAAELGPAALEYAELYDLFAVQFDEVSLVGVVPFRGVVFAELGGEDEETPAVSVDTRLAPPDGPSVFVVVAGQRSDRKERPALDPYAIVQVPEQEEPRREATLGLEAAFAEARLKVELLTAQLEEARDRIAVVDVRSIEATERLDRVAAERDGALTRAMELEAVLAASQQAMATLERRLLEAEQGILDRDDRIAVLSAELDARRSAEAPYLVAPFVNDVIDVGPLLDRAERAETALAVALAELSARQENVEAAAHLDASLEQMRDRAERAESALAVAVEELSARQETQTIAVVDNELAQLRERAERAEAALALNVADLAHVADAHAKETESYEEQLRDRARVIASLEKELVRREQLVKELVATLEESREGGTNGAVFEAAPPLSVASPVKPDLGAADENVRLRKRLDELAGEVARREGELVARGWRITELENQLKNAEERARLEPEFRPESGEAAAADESKLQAPDGGTEPALAELARARDEIDALRQALTQEHAARVAAESGEELAHARSELARQAALLEQMRGRIESS